MPIHDSPTTPSGNAVAHAPWNVVLRALREASGVTQDGWAAHLGVGRRTLQRWEVGEIAPDARSEAHILELCRKRALFRRYEQGPLAGVTLSPEWLQALLASARLATRTPQGGEGGAPDTVDAPPPGSAALPTPLTSLIGRDRDIDAVAGLLSMTRLVTLTGPGGTGKTRLALAVAETIRRGASETSCPDGVWFVDLSALTDPVLVTSTIARTLGMRESEGRPLTETLTAHLRDKRLLLVIDNFEQVVDAAPSLHGLLRACPGLTLLVTSRVLLRLSGEREYPVPPLAVPDASQPINAASLAALPSVALFVQRAREARSNFALTDENATVIAAICTRLDGLPLALELAAARIRILNPQALLGRLDRSLTVLTGGTRDLPQRQQTLRDTIAWSYTLLPDEEQALFRRLSVFAGGWTLTAVEAICITDDDQAIDLLDRLGSLMAKSLLHQDEEADDEPRFTMLETIREYAQEQLIVRGEAGTSHQRHAAYYLALVEQAEPDLLGADPGPAVRRLEIEHSNLLAALSWSVSQGERRTVVRLAGALGGFWLGGGYLSEGRRWLEDAVAGTDPTADGARAKALYMLGRIVRFQDGYPRAVDAFEESLHLSRQVGDFAGMARCLNSLGTARLHQGDVDRAAALVEESLALSREMEDPSGIAWSLQILGEVAEAQGELERAATLFEEDLTLRRSVGDLSGIANALDALGRVRQSQRDYVQAAKYFEQSLTVRRAAGVRLGLGGTLLRLAGLLSGKGEFGRAAVLLGESLALFRELGSSEYIASCLLTFGRLAERTGRPERAACLFGAGEALLEARGLVLPVAYRGFHERSLARVRAALSDDAFAAAYQAGHAISLDAAVALALEQTGSG